MLETKSYDRAAFVKTHQSRVYWYLRFLGASEHQAEDLVQETFLAVLKSKFSFKTPKESMKYLKTSARRLYLKQVAKEQQVFPTDQLEVVDHFWEEVSAQEHQADHLKALEQCIATLGDHARKALELRYQQQASYEAVGSKLGLKLNSVKSLLRRSRQALAECLQRRLQS